VRRKEKIVFESWSAGISDVGGSLKARTSKGHNWSPQRRRLLKSGWGRMRTSNTKKQRQFTRGARELQRVHADWDRALRGTWETSPRTTAGTVGRGIPGGSETPIRPGPVTLRAQGMWGRKKNHSRSSGVRRSKRPSLGKRKSKERALKRFMTPLRARDGMLHKGDEKAAPWGKKKVNQAKKTTSGREKKGFQSRERGRRGLRGAPKKS